MFTPKSLDEIAAKLSDAVANSPLKDFEKNARALLAQGFSKLDLVTREEFDVQTQLAPVACAWCLRLWPGAAATVPAAWC